MSENKKVTKAAGIVGLATLLSRILGFIRDMVIARYFGAGFSTDAFFVAFRIPNLLRRLFAEGSLSIAFIPVFTEHLKKNGKDEAFQMARSALRLLAVLLVVVIIVGILLAPIIVHVIAPGFSNSPEKHALTVLLTRIMFPYVFFICLVALCMGILNVLGHFAAPALAPVFLNLAMIASVYLISSEMPDPVLVLAFGVLAGGVLQLLLQLPFLVKKGFYFWEKASFYHPGLKKIGKLMLPAVFGAGVYQVNILVGTLLASFLKEGSISYLYYADRLVQFPLGIFAISTATALMPIISRQAAEKDYASVKETFAYAMRLIFFITLPSMAGLIVLREPIIKILFQRGNFNVEAAQLTAYAVLCYGVGLWAFSAVRIVVSTFYALSDTKTPVKMATISIAVNIMLGISLMWPLGHGGLALATSLASMLNFGMLIRVLKTRLGALGWKNICFSVLRSFVCAVLMGVVVWALSGRIIPDEGTFWENLSGLSGSVILGFFLYILFSFLVKSPELKYVLNTFKKGEDGR